MENRHGDSIRSWSSIQRVPSVSPFGFPTLRQDMAVDLAQSVVATAKGIGQLCVVEVQQIKNAPSRRWARFRFRRCDGGDRSILSYDRVRQQMPRRSVRRCCVILQTSSPGPEQVPKRHQPKQVGGCSFPPSIRSRVR